MSSTIQVHLSRCNPTETIETVGFKIGPNTKNTIVVMSSSGVELSKAYDLRTKTMSCPSASGDYETPAVPLPPPPPVSTSNSGGDCSCSNTIVRQENGKHFFLSRFCHYICHYLSLSFIIRQHFRAA